MQKSPRVYCEIYGIDRFNIHQLVAIFIPFLVGLLLLQPAETMAKPGLNCTTINGFFLPNLTVKNLAKKACDSAFENNVNGQTTYFADPRSGIFAEITPSKTYEIDGQRCREYRVIVGIKRGLSRRQTKLTGVACRSQNGGWWAYNGQIDKDFEKDKA
jgi:hypothetical protein